MRPFRQWYKDEEFEFYSEIMENAVERFHDLIFIFQRSILLIDRKG